MKFHSSIQSPQAKPKQGWWFVFRENDILVRPLNDKLLIPLVTDISELELEPVRKLYLGSLDDAPCYSAELPPETVAPEGMSFEGLRGVFGLLEEEIFWLAGRSFQIINWDPGGVSSISIQVSHDRGTPVAFGLNGRKTYQIWVDGITGTTWQNF